MSHLHVEEGWERIDYEEVGARIDQAKAACEVLRLAASADGVELRPPVIYDLMLAVEELLRAALEDLGRNPR